MMARHWPEVDVRRDTFTADFGANLMAGLAPRALLFSTGDLIRNSFYYQQLCLGRRPDATLVEQPMMAAPWYVTQLRRRHALRLPDTMTVYVGATDTGSRAWLDLNLGRRSPEPRLVAAIRFIDDSWAAAYRMRTMGIWSAVEPRASAVNLAAWCDSFSNTVREWRLPSLGREYGKTRWETTEGIFYPYALGRLKALRELLGEREPGGSPRAAVPALDVADGWRGSGAPSASPIKPMAGSRWSAIPWCPAEATWRASAPTALSRSPSRASHWNPSTYRRCSPWRRCGIPSRAIGIHAQRPPCGCGSSSSVPATWRSSNPTSSWWSGSCGTRLCAIRPFSIAPRPSAGATFRCSSCASRSGITAISCAWTSAGPRHLQLRSPRP